MTLERIRAAQSEHLDAVELTAWWSTTVLELETSLLVTYADEVTLGEGTVSMTDLDPQSRNLAQLAVRVGAEVAVVSGTVAEASDIDQALTRAGESDSDPQVTKRLKTLRRAAPVLTSLDVLLLSAAGVRVNVSICSSDEDVVFDSVFSARDEDDELGSDRFTAPPRYSEEEIATALEAKQEEIIAAVHGLCTKDPFEMHAVLIPYLKDFPDVRPHDIPRRFTVALRQKAAEVHGRELAAMCDSLVPELFALVPPPQVASATIGELVATAREVQRRHHDCANSDTAKSLIRQAKKAAKQAIAPTLL